MSEPVFHLRHFEPERDMAFCADAWAHSGQLVYKQTLGGLYREHVYWQFAGDMARSLLGVAETVVACDSKNRDVIIGFACGEPERWRWPILHYVYCKYNTRNFGVAPQCLAAIGVHRDTKVVCTAWSDWCKSENKKRRAGGNPMMYYNPYFVGVSNVRSRAPVEAQVSNGENSFSDRVGGEQPGVLRSWLDR